MSLKTPSHLSFIHLINKQLTANYKLQLIDVKFQAQPDLAKAPSSTNQLIISTNHRKQHTNKNLFVKKNHTSMTKDIYLPRYPPP